MRNPVANQSIAMCAMCLYHILASESSRLLILAPQRSSYQIINSRYKVSGTFSHWKYTKMQVVSILSVEK